MAPVALQEDRDKLVMSPLLWSFVLTPTSKGRSAKKSEAFAIKDVQKRVIPDLREPIAAATDRVLPPGVGWLWLAGKRLYFLLKDVHGSPALPSQSPAAEVKASDGRGSRADFALAFQDAFDRLDRHHGSHNFVSLVDLRRGIPCDRPTFDAELHKLRLAGRYTLSAAEGRHGITPEERQAGISEEGSLLLFVSRKTP
jgi:hypothetical protein